MPRLRLSRVVLGLVLVVFAVPPSLRSEAALTPQELVRHVSLHEAASVRLQAAGRTVYFDPFFDGKVVAPPADLIVITHDHDRHCSDRTLARILEPDTTLIAPEGCRRMLSGVAKNTVTLAAPGVVTKVGEITVEVVPAYTPHHPDHARERGGVGYVVTLGGVRIYHSGSTELVPELQVVRADVAVLAFWEGYIMSTQQAAELARTLQAKVVVPTHCKPEEAVKLRDLLEGAAQVELMAPKVGPPGSRKVPLRFSMATLAVSYPRLRTRDEGLRSRHEPLGPLNPRVVDLTRAGEKPADYRTAGARPNGEIVDAFALVSVQKDAREEGVGLGGRRWQSAGDAEPERERAVHASQRLRLEDAYRGADPLAPNSAHLVDHRL